MGQFSRIEIHFDTTDGRRRAVILPQKIVQAIFLNGLEDEFVVFRKSDLTTPVPKQDISQKPDGVTLLPEQSTTLEGPGAVCYLVNGVLQCWGKG
ncbi:MAG TPA: hypothetical protein VFO95_12720 [Gemmatimonadales bacterium]|nr:hypothetical protein [Gemmatimonadales bacterium]